MKTVHWQYCRNLNSINDAIENNKRHQDWRGITADNIISITYDSNRRCYVVFWKLEETEV